MVILILNKAQKKIPKKKIGENCDNCMIQNLAFFFLYLQITYDYDYQKMMFIS